VILTRLEGGKTPMPDGEHIREFARHGTTMAIFLSAARSGQLVDELRAGGYPDDTPVVVAYKVTWPDELVLHTTVGELSETVKQHKLWRHTLFLVGKALSATGTRSHLYNAGHFHTYRKADPVARRALRAAELGVEPESRIETDEPTAKSRAGWPLHTSRSGWVAARVGTGTWTSTTSKPDAVSQPASAAAWSAVHGWQETARSTSRSGAKPAAKSDNTRALRPVPTDQESFTFEPDSVKSETVKSETVQPESTAPETPEIPKPQVPKTVDSPKPKSQNRQGNRKNGPKRTNNNGRKVAGRSTQGGQGQS
jgi:hypothetical protein